MNDLEQRLKRCFLAVFPSLQEGAVASASQETLAEWDSLSSIKLIAVIEEEFEIAIDLFDMEDLLSFSLLSEYLRSRTGPSSAA